MGIVELWKVWMLVGDTGINFIIINYPVSNQAETDKPLNCTQEIELSGQCPLFD